MKRARMGRLRGRGAPRARAALGLALLVGAFGLALAGRAEAYVRYKTATGFQFYWAQTWVPVTVYPASMTDVNGGMDMTPDQIMKAAMGAAGAWSGTENACTYLQINVTSSTDAAPQAGYDKRNSLVFRTSSWCAPTDKALACSYDPSALAITSVFVNTKTGHIRDTDIEVNARNFVWTDLDDEPKVQGKQDLQNALAHEMGHLIGLDHTCFQAGAMGEWPIDDQGNLVPDCNTASDDVRATTMFASAIPGDVDKRTLAPDDARAVCEIYPLADDPMIYKMVDDATGCRCALGASGGAGQALGALVPLAAIVVSSLRRRRRARGG